MKTIIEKIAASLIGLLIASATTLAQNPAPIVQNPVPTATNAPPPAEKADLDLKYNGMPLDLVLKEYSEKTGRTILMAPGVPNVSLTMTSQSKLTRSEWLQAVESVLAMNGIALLKEGDKFLKVVPSNKARQESMKIREDAEKHEVAENDELISQVIRLQHIDIAEARKVITPFLHGAFGAINDLERVNSVMITDSAANINRILQIIKQIDLPMEAKEEPNIVKIHYAKAADIKRKLEEIMAQTQAEQQKKPTTVARPALSGPPVVERAPMIPGVIRPPAPTPVVPAVEPVGGDDASALAERGIIRGKVHIVADDRTNLLIIITRPENMTFFEKIIKVLDVATSPDVVVEVIRLEYAAAEDVASTLNTLIGAVKKDAAAAPPLPGRDVTPGDRVSALRDYVAQVQQDRSTKITDAQKSKLGELSADSIKVLPDKRTNSLLIMATKSDFDAIREVIRNMDMMLSQVLIEAVIMEVELGGNIQTGVDWVQRAMVAYDTKNPVTRTPMASFAGGGGGAGGYIPQNATALSSAGAISPGAGLTYYLTYFGLNLDAVLHMAAKDGRTKILSSPVIVTHDNTEANIDATQTAYIYKGKKWVGTSTEGRYEDDVEQREVGLHLKVKPHINEKKLVVMEIDQKIEELADSQTIGDTSWPTFLSRNMKASISVQSRNTIVLGGLVKRKTSKVDRGIPFLYKIPLIGWIFGYSSDESTRGEIIVFITPYVLNTAEEIEAEARRRQNATETKGLWQKGWSESRLAEGQDSTADVKPPAVATPPLAPPPGVNPPVSEPAAPVVKPAVPTPFEPESPVPATPEPMPAKVDAPAAAPVDPAVLRFLEEQNRKYGAAEEDADRKMEKELEEAGIPAPEKP